MIGDDVLGIFGASAETERPVSKATPPATCPPPGVYRNIPAHIYHAWDAIGSTTLKAYAEYPAKCLDPFTGSDDSAIGSGVHAYTLQGETGLTEECFILPPECEGRGKAAVAARTAYAAAHPMKTLLPPRCGKNEESRIDMRETLEAIDTALRDHPKVGPVLRDSEKELSLVWIDERTGRRCKARLDIWQARTRLPWDLKKTRDITRFQWHMRELFYHVQAGHYFNGAHACGLEPVGFGFIPFEAFPPYRVGFGYVQMDDPDRLAAARVEAERLIALYHQSQELNWWPTFQIPADVWDLDDIKQNPDLLAQVW